jgi:uncharacterized protein YbjT (DUF2867 family)
LAVAAMSDVLITGATGTTGSRVAAFLSDRGVSTRLATRTPNASGQVRFDWADRGTHGDALRGVSAVYLIAPAVAGHALTDDQSHNTEHVLTGPEALTYADAAGIITDATGRTVGHRSVSADESARRIAAHGVPAEFAKALAAMDVAISDGAEDRVTDTVHRVTGRPARTFSSFVAREIRRGH